MVLKKNLHSKLKYDCWNDLDLDDIEKELGVVRCMGALGRKRVEPSPCSSPFKTPLKRQCSVKLNSEKSLLEALPQDIIVRILCGVEHEDLGRLLLVSKSIQEATLIAKGWHFAFRTPSSKAATLRFYSDVEDANFDNSPILNAPKQGKGYWSRTKGKNISDISVALFRSPEKDQFSRFG
ncbi:F-box protein skip27 [Thalictrum thalictroides]|uniref:F-box protein skip27 n=1 Tax=Thalictrum thalictroides TaxID=46969 RepID=A0A7J6X8L6_THATH|nr:F-box protein skip27 [Thalictrum thalictroides]